MTISSATARASYNGDGATVSFSTAFAFLDNSHVAVIHRSTAGVETTWTEGTQYTLTGAGTGSAGTVTVATVPTDYTPASGERLVILRNVPATQNRDLPPGGSFPSQTVEEGLDQLTMLAQQVIETLTRTLRFGETSTAEATLPDPTANNLIGWNSAGDDLTNIALTAITAVFDTILTGLSDGDYLSYDGGQAVWVNRTPAEVLSTLGLGDLAVLDEVGAADMEADWLGDLSAATVASGDLILIGDADASNVQKRTTVGDILALAPAATHAIFRHEVADNTAGGASTSGSWEKRTLNATQANGITGASLSSSTVTLPAGTYKFSWSAVAYNTTRFQTRLANTTADPDTYVYGLVVWPGRDGGAGQQAMDISSGEAVLTVAVETTFELQQRVAESSATNGYGIPANFGNTEVYASLAIEKLS